MVCVIKTIGTVVVSVSVNQSVYVCM